jgi:tetratricopeptide (TPR) repeat protein
MLIIRKSLILSITLFLVLFLLFRPVLSQGNTDYKYFYSKANSMLVSGDFEQALTLYSKAIQKNPDSSDAYLGLGIAYKELGRNQEAYNATRMALNLKPSYYQAYYNLGIILENMGKSEEAVDAYEKFLKEVPGAERFSDAKQRIIKLKKNFSN